MPISTEVILPGTKDASEFEDIVCDVCKKKYKKEFQKYGRSGQKQNGIDIISIGIKKIICIQCKNCKISKKDIVKMINDVKECGLRISKFIIATNMFRDVKLQKFITEINNCNTENINFGICIIFWEDISNIIVSHKKLFRKYFSVIKREKPIDSVIRKFKDSIEKYEILYFLDEDPIVGIHKNDFESVELFVKEVGLFLDEEDILKENPRYAAISKFTKMIKKYHNYLCRYLYPVNDVYKAQKYYFEGEMNYEEFMVDKNAIIYKYELERLYGIIFNSHTKIFDRLKLSR